MNSVCAIALDYYDGHSARAYRITARLSGDTLYLQGAGVARSVPVREVQWPERSRHGRRVAHLPDGSSLHSSDAAAWDAWAEAGGQRESLVSRTQRSWAWVFGCLVLLALLTAGVYQWGLPWVARGVVQLVPASVDASLGESAYASIRSALLAPSELPATQQAQLQEAFRRAVVKAYPRGDAPPWRLHFHRSKIGPNALALPGGTIVVTDELVKLVEGDAEVIVGVLAHELGHVEHRHGMRALVQTTLLGVVSSIAFGDFSGWLATAPVILGQAGYSRDAEREADRASIRVLQAAGHSPMAMVRFFEKIRRPAKADPGGRPPRPMTPAGTIRCWASPSPATRPTRSACSSSATPPPHGPEAGTTGRRAGCGRGSVLPGPSRAGL
ncbi:M48 family metallopeptidase [Aquabacterium sp. A7-Y]|uniref:M48 family metallopeptidase n=1 Tax=Aquabacterium sp. A7-Y TaxID=1349605 RepID=UPI00223DF77C|nr:M48 family metallopeptidase [Aquabacterium sp. A7-Y]MCW7538852.1 M48 family metallopeptidase [Aquabacterium sp. A7-Y]